jgi:hypothetical protein
MIDLPPRPLAVLSSACRRALQWRLLLLWLLAEALPLVLAILPLWAAIADKLDESPLARRVVEDFDASLYADVWTSLLRDRGPAGAAGASIVLVLLLPWLSGTLLTAARDSERPDLASLVRGGVAEYGRMARLWLWSLLLLGLAAAGGKGLLGLADRRVAKLVLAGDAEHLLLAARGGVLVLFLLVHTTVDATRAQLALEPQRRSVVIAWWRACVRLVCRPIHLAFYLIITFAGLSLTALFVYARLRIPAVGGLGFSSAFLLGELGTAALVWMRCARVFALVGQHA